MAAPTVNITANISLQFSSLVCIGPIRLDGNECLCFLPLSFFLFFAFCRRETSSLTSLFFWTRKIPNDAGDDEWRRTV